MTCGVLYIFSKFWFYSNSHVGIKTICPESRPIQLQDLAYNKDNYKCSLIGHLRSEQCNAEDVLKSLYVGPYTIIVQLLNPHLTKTQEIVNQLISLGRIEDKKSEEVNQRNSVAELSKYLELDKKWNDLSCLYNLISCLYVPNKEMYHEAFELLDHYNEHLIAYRYVIAAVKKRLKALRRSSCPPPKEGMIKVEITVRDSISELTYKDCLDLWRMILVEGAGIPRDEIIWGSARTTQSTTVTFYVSQVYKQAIIVTVTRGSTLWAMLDLGVIKVAIPGIVEFCINWSMASSYIKQALLSVRKIL